MTGAAQPAGSEATARPGRPPALPSLTGLRFIAAALVFCFHITLFNSPIPPFGAINPFRDQGLADSLSWITGKAGYVGVSFFFVLSGFVLFWSTRPEEGALPFWRRRMLKIFPNHLVMFGLAMVLFAGAITPARAWLPNAFLLHSFFPQADTYVSVNPPGWTLCSELLFYLLFPLLAIPVRKIADRRLWFWAGLMVAGTLAIALVSQFLVPSSPKSPITPVSALQFWIGYIFPPSRLFEFVLGMLVARLVLAGRAPRIGILPAVLSLVAGYAIALEVPFLYGFQLATMIPIALVIMVFAEADVAGRWTGMRGRVAVKLGEISFGFYICQGVTVFYVRRLLGPDPFNLVGAIAVVAGLFLVTLAGGYLLYTFVEDPIMRRFARARPKAELRALPTPAEEEGLRKAS